MKNQPAGLSKLSTMIVSSTLEAWKKIQKALIQFFDWIANPSNRWISLSASALIALTMYVFFYPFIGKNPAMK